MKITKILLPTLTLCTLFVSAASWSDFELPVHNGFGHGEDRDGLNRAAHELAIEADHYTRSLERGCHGVPGEQLALHAARDLAAEAEHFSERVRDRPFEAREAYFRLQGAFRHAEESLHQLSNKGYEAEHVFNQVRDAMHQVDGHMNHFEID